MGVAPDEERPVDALLAPVLADRLGGGQDVRLVERRPQARARGGPRCRTRPAGRRSRGRARACSTRSPARRRRRGRRVGRAVRHGARSWCRSSQRRGRAPHPVVSGRSHAERLLRAVVFDTRRGIVAAMTTTTKNLVVLGAGTAGTMVVNKLRRALPTEEWTITVVDRDDIHDYQPGYLFMAFGTNSPQQVRRHKRPFISKGVELVLAEVDRVDPEARVVHLGDGRELPYDQLVIATGTTPRPDQVPGTLGPQWHHEVGEFYTYEGALALRDRLRRLHGWPPRRAHHRDADQVPRRAAGVHLPRRRLPRQARSARPHRDRLRHPARRRVHQAGRQRGARHDARGARASPSSRTS